MATEAHLNAAPVETPPEPDVAEHERTFENFTKGMAIFAAHVIVILGILAAASL